MWILSHLLFWYTKGYWEKGQSERKCHTFSFAQVDFKMRKWTLEVSIYPSESGWQSMNHQECLGWHCWQNEGVQRRYFQTRYLTPSVGSCIALIPLFGLHELCFICLFLNSTDIFECLLSVLHCSIHWDVNGEINRAPSGMDSLLGNINK